jgi:hypothetical protein
LYAVKTDASVLTFGVTGLGMNSIFEKPIPTSKLRRHGIFGLQKFVGSLLSSAPRW